MSKLRTLWFVFSLLAVMHLLVLSAVLTFAWMHGTLTPARVDQMAAVLRGERDGPAETAPPTGPAQAEPSGTSEATLTRELMQEEITRRQLEREKAELDQRLELVLREMDRVRQEREYFEEQRRREAEAAKKKGESDYRTGLQKELEYFTKMKPKDAVEYLLNREAEEAAELLRAMDSRQGKKIIEAAKTPNQRKKMDEILKLLPELKLEGGETADQD